MVVGFLVCLIILIIVAALVPPSGNLGRFERERRKDQSGIEVLREFYQSDVVSLQRILTALLLVGMVGFAIGSFGWTNGIIIMCVVAILYGRIAGMKFFRRFSIGLYGTFEHRLLGFIEKHAGFMHYIRSYAPQAAETRVHSREELAYLLGNATGHILTETERQMLLAGLEFSSKTARDVMTQRAAIASVKKHEILGPLVLDDLHKSGHSHFPVIDDDLDHIVGILYVNEYLTLDTTRKHTLRADSAMSPRVECVDERETLENVLKKMVSLHQHLLIVTNDHDLTVGLVTLKDIVTALVGRKL